MRKCAAMISHRTQDARGVGEIGSQESPPITQMVLLRAGHPDGHARAFDMTSDSDF